jgi:predicted DNA-binding transcriptional regulator AlpA
MSAKRQSITLLPMREALRRLGHSRRWVFDRIKAGELEAFKHSHSDVRISAESIDHYLDRTRISAGFL